ncbi:MAG: SDR family NAD(P)-dependent oxidoreductase [Chitinispirillaceae bacterium]|nr:SDR family NAD(P)-dependent oxidoreductase [Chitinispirillaceae bacterium]
MTDARSEQKKQKASLCAPAIRTLLRPRMGGCCVTVFFCNVDIAKIVRSAKTFAEAAGGEKNALFIPEKKDAEAWCEAITAALKRYGTSSVHAPAFIGLQDTGIFSIAETKAGADANIRDLFRACKTRKRPVFWKDNAPGGRVAGKIAVITGSAQGFGKGIAEMLAREGAYVVIADINEHAAKKFADSVCRTHGAGRALAISADVTREDSIRSLMAETVLAYGGIDIFISNAGILKAGGLEEMDLAAFELVTKINYSAFYLGTKYASRYMKIQHRYDHERWSDIIQINSKSGLEGSNRNFAYAGGKFGSIGLTQSFALELVDFNIKVNAICPGNFFEGPLWSDPERGLFVQYLRAKKVPGAGTIEDVKRFYESKVPMKRGCRVGDITAAVLYLIEQQYETGQAFPVTGGQVMLR